MEGGKRKRTLNDKKPSGSATSNQNQQQSISISPSSASSSSGPHGKKSKTKKRVERSSTSSSDYSIVTRSKSQRNTQVGSTSSSSSSSNSREERPSKRAKKSTESNSTSHITISSQRQQQSSSSSSSSSRFHSIRATEREEIKRALKSPEKVLETVLKLNTKDIPDLIEDEDNKEELAQITSSASHVERIPQQQEGRDLLLANLDRLAWLLQDNTRSCSSVCLINKKLLLSDNHIHHSSREDSNAVQYKTAILNYFTLVAQEVVSANELKQERGALIEKILETKFKGENMGYLKPIGEESKNRIINALLDCARKYFDDSMRTEDIRQRMITACEKVLRETPFAETQHYATVGLCIKAICRLRRVERFLKNSESGSKRLKEALAGPSGKSKQEECRIIRYSKGSDNVPMDEDKEWLHSPNQNGCAILAINLDDVHTELRAIDFLIASRAITTYSGILDEDAYIGISKKCCLNCDLVVKAVNEALSRNYLRVSGSHNRPFDYKNLPYFLQKARTRSQTRERRSEQASSSTAALGRDKELCKEIREIFEEKAQNQSSCIADSRMSADTHSLRSHSLSEASSFDNISPIPDENTSPHTQGTLLGDSLLTSGQNFFAPTSSTSSESIRNASQETANRSLEFTRQGAQDMLSVANDPGVTFDKEKIDDLVELLQDIQKENNKRLEAEESMKLKKS